MFPLNGLSIKDAVKRQLMLYVPEENNNVADNIKNLEFHVNKTDSLVSDFFDIYRRIGKLEAEHLIWAINAFSAGMQFQLGDEKGVYRIIECKRKNIDAFTDFYVGKVVDVIFIEYEEYLVAIIVGKDEECL